MNKQETLEENEVIYISDHDGIGNAVDNLNNEPPQETLEEAKQRILEANYMSANDGDIFEMGVEWQAARMHSDDEVKHLIHLACSHSGVTLFKKFDKWFSQHKKQK